MAKLIVDMDEKTKAEIQKYADDNELTIKQVTLRALRRLIKTLSKK